MTVTNDAAFTAMTNGEWYFDSEATVQQRNETRLALQKTGQILDNATRMATIQKLLGHTGSDFFIETGFEFSFGQNISVGDHYYANRNVLICDEGRVTIGDSCKFGPGVSLLTPYHPLDPTERATKKEISGAITIGDHVWLGANVTILPGVSLGNNVVVGAGSVVTKSYPDNVILVGNPARVLREIPAK
ncbi:sugar O-acetyltransferase [Latilactobacillus sakei]|uniref:sugar O-acetyltransferase n=1 Tax=Latilactobacillus sakei TaxID=1599 RepID=UPI0020C7EBE1|nr:sugar O-acetyltransferase [Latilactobacillus sakei]MCP8853648.1 sugar O-acetyltransferase [Latilactobacillus sakei]